MWCLPEEGRGVGHANSLCIHIHLCTHSDYKCISIPLMSSKASADRLCSTTCDPKQYNDLMIHVKWLQQNSGCITADASVHVQGLLILVCVCVFLLIKVAVDTKLGGMENSVSSPWVSGWSDSVSSEIICTSSCIKVWKSTCTKKRLPASSSKAVRSIVRDGRVRMFGCTL